PVTYTLDPFHPGLRRCDRCGPARPVALDPWDDPDELRGMTEDVACDYWPGLAPGLRLHGMLCPEAWFTDEEAAAEALPWRTGDQGPRPSRGPMTRPVTRLPALGF